MARLIRHQQSHNQLHIHQYTRRKEMNYCPNYCLTSHLTKSFERLVKKLTSYLKSGDLCNLNYYRSKKGTLCPHNYYVITIRSNKLFAQIKFLTLCLQILKKNLNSFNYRVIVHKLKLSVILAKLSNDS